MALMCDTCFRIDKRKYRYGVFCKDKSCNGWMVEIDELFLPSISILNKKGYFTKYCCSSHVWEEGILDPYISFDKNVELPSLPDGFHYDEHNNNPETKCIRRYIDVKLDAVDRQREILITAMNVLDWAKDLEDINNIIDDDK